MPKQSPTLAKVPENVATIIGATTKNEEERRFGLKVWKFATKQRSTSPQRKTIPAKRAENISAAILAGLGTSAAGGKPVKSNGKTPGGNNKVAASA